MRAVPVGGQYGQLTAQPPKQRTRAAGSVPLLKEMPHMSNISSISNRYTGCNGSQMLLTNAELREENPKTSPENLINTFCGAP